MTTELAALIVVVTLAALAGITIVSLVFIARAMGVTAHEMRRLHLQQGTIVAMLLKAGFRPARGGRDWSDDAARTRQVGELDQTDYDWRRPGH
jgi:hypothetical protein